MRVEIVLGDEFKRQFKRLAKKYPSLKDDFITFKKELSDEPLQGTDLFQIVKQSQTFFIFCICR